MDPATMEAILVTLKVLMALLSVGLLIFAIVMAVVALKPSDPYDKPDRGFDDYQ